MLLLLYFKRISKLNNKQYLFDKRVKYYLIANELIQSYEKTYSLLEDRQNGPTHDIDSVYILMTQNTYLEDIINSLDYVSIPPHYDHFLSKMEEIKNVSAKIKFIFGGKSVILLEDFLLCYRDLLFKMYSYKSVLKRRGDPGWKLEDENFCQTEFRRAFGILDKAYNTQKKRTSSKKD